MRRLQVGVVRYASAARAIADALGLTPAPQCRVGQGRITITFRQTGRSRWSESEQMAEALRVAEVARNVMNSDARRVIRDRVQRAVVVVYEDSAVVQGCAVVARWECVVPSGT